MRNNRVTTLGLIAVMALVLTSILSAKPFDMICKSSNVAHGKPVATQTPDKSVKPVSTAIPVKIAKPIETPTQGLEEKAVSGILTVDEITSRVDKAQDLVKDAQMQLKMTVKDLSTGQKQTVKGGVMMKTPDKLYTHYTQPVEQFLYISKDLVQMYQPEQQMVYRQKVTTSQGQGPVYLGVGKQLKRYTLDNRVSVIKDTSDEVTLLFMPRDPNAPYSRMKVTIGKKNWWPYQIEMETSTMKTQVTFDKFVFDQGLEDSLFEFTPPKDAEIVEGAIF